IYLKPGDRLFLYTDGVTEAQNKTQQLYGEENLLKFAGSHQMDEPEAFLNGLSAELADFQSDCDQFDDITMLIMDYKAATI
ncbi:MAG: serine/threonine-protein phosphatase, partial [Spirochaetia bacterium]|nr:serine/threonine-protein phosphatase [Spirochaetia bacterium]